MLPWGAAAPAGGQQFTTQQLMAFLETLRSMPGYRSLYSELETWTGVVPYLRSNATKPQSVQVAAHRLAMLQVAERVIRDNAIPRELAYPEHSVSEQQAEQRQELQQQPQQQVQPQQRPRQQAHPSWLNTMSAIASCSVTKCLYSCSLSRHIERVSSCAACICRQYTTSGRHRCRPAWAQSGG